MIYPVFGIFGISIILVHKVPRFVKQHTGSTQDPQIHFLARFPCHMALSPEPPSRDAVLVRTRLYLHKTEMR